MLCSLLHAPNPTTLLLAARWCSEAQPAQATPVAPYVLKVKPHKLTQLACMAWPRPTSRAHPWPTPPATLEMLRV